MKLDVDTEVENNANERTRFLSSQRKHFQQKFVEFFISLQQLHLLALFYINYMFNKFIKHEILHNVFFCPNLILSCLFDKHLYILFKLKGLSNCSIAYRKQLHTFKPQAVCRHFVQETF